jgi:hypothetical protein
MLVFKSKPLPSQAELKLEQIIQLLFPPLEIDEVTDAEGNTVKFHTDRSIDSNLEAVQIDLEEGLKDAVTYGTIKDAIARLIKIRKILGVVPLLNLDAEYVRVQPLELDVELGDEIV